MSNNILHWSKRELISHSIDSWYDINIYKIPVSGTVDTSKILTALRNKFRPTGGNGGYSTVEDVSDNHDGSVNVKFFYHIGN